MGRKPTGRTSRTITIRVPMDLYDRIDTLAKKRLSNINAWCVSTLERVTRARKPS